MSNYILRFGVFVLVPDIDPIAVNGEADDLFMLQNQHFDQVRGIEEGAFGDEAQQLAFYQIDAGIGVVVVGGFFRQTSYVRILDVEDSVWDRYGVGDCRSGHVGAGLDEL